MARRPGQSGYLVRSGWPAGWMLPQGAALYYFAGDPKPSDTKGQGLNKISWVVAANGSLVKTAP